MNAESYGGAVSAKEESANDAEEKSSKEASPSAMAPNTCIAPNTSCHQIRVRLSGRTYAS